MSTLSPEWAANTVDEIKKRQAEAFEIPQMIVASAHFRIGEDLEVRTGVFDRSTPIGDVYKWAAMAKATVIHTPRPFKIVISAAEQPSGHAPGQNEN